MTFLTICAHASTRFVRLEKGARITRCNDCGCEFASKPDQRDADPMPPRPDHELTSRGARYRASTARAERLRVENARKRMFGENG